MANAGDKIRVGDYNTIRNTFISYLTTGSGDIGYGQSANSSAVSVGNKVTSLQWANLASDIQRMASHQGTAITLPTISTTTKLRASAINQLQTAANTVIAAGNRFNLAEFSDEPLLTSQRTTAWNSTIRHRFTLTFSTAAQARYFFNAGSTIRFAASFVKSSSTSINNNWETLIGSTSLVTFGHTATTATGTSVGTSQPIGYYDLTSSAQTIYTKGGTSPYAVNDYTITALCNVASNVSGTANVITFDVQFNDDKGPNPNFDENVTGTVTSTITMRRASGSNVAVTGPTPATTIALST